MLATKYFNPLTAGRGSTVSAARRVRTVSGPRREQYPPLPVSQSRGRAPAYYAFCGVGRIARRIEFDIIYQYYSSRAIFQQTIERIKCSSEPAKHLANRTCIGGRTKHVATARKTKRLSDHFNRTVCMQCTLGLKAKWKAMQ